MCKSIQIGAKNTSEKYLPKLNSKNVLYKSLWSLVPRLHAFAAERGHMQQISIDGWHAAHAAGV